MAEDNRTRKYQQLVVLLLLFLGVMVFLVRALEPRTDCTTDADCRGGPGGKCNADGRCVYFPVPATEGLTPTPAEGCGPAKPCPAGTACTEGFCLKVEAAKPQCKAGHLVTNCICPPHLLVKDGKCVDATFDAECANANFLAACKTALDACGGLPASQCTSADFQSLRAKEPDKVIALMELFRNRLAFVFPTAVPYPDGSKATPPEMDGLLTDFLTKNKEAIGKAKFLFVIGRASPRGGQQFNERLAMRRIGAVNGAISRVFGVGPGSPYLRTRAIGLGEEPRFQMTIPEFQAMFGASFTGASNVVQQVVENALLPGADGVAFTQATPIINQSVALILVPCDCTKAGAVP